MGRAHAEHRRRWRNMLEARTICLVNRRLAIRNHRHGVAWLWGLLAWLHGRKARRYLELAEEARDAD